MEIWIYSEVSPPEKTLGHRRGLSFWKSQLALKIFLLSLSLSLFLLSLSTQFRPAFPSFLPFQPSTSLAKLQLPAPPEPRSSAFAWSASTATAPAPGAAARPVGRLECTQVDSCPPCWGKKAVSYFFSYFLSYFLFFTGYFTPVGGVKLIIYHLIFWCPPKLFNLSPATVELYLSTSIVDLIQNVPQGKESECEAEVIWLAQCLSHKHRYSTYSTPRIRSVLDLFLVDAWLTLPTDGTR